MKTWAFMACACAALLWSAAASCEEKTQCIFVPGGYVGLSLCLDGTCREIRDTQGRSDGIAWLHAGLTPFRVAWLDSIKGKTELRIDLEARLGGIFLNDALKSNPVGLLARASLEPDVFAIGDRFSVTLSLSFAAGAQWLPEPPDWEILAGDAGDPSARGLLQPGVGLRIRLFSPSFFVAPRFEEGLLPDSTWGALPTWSLSVGGDVFVGDGSN